MSRSHSSSQSSKPNTAAARSSSKSKFGIEEDSSPTWIDPYNVKQWSRAMGVLLYSSDLPSSYQLLCEELLDAVVKQEDCNAVIDEIVKAEVDSYFLVFTAKRGRVVQSIEYYLDAFVSQTNTFIKNCTIFYHQLGLAAETHSSNVLDLRRITREELSDCSERSRFALMDLENEYANVCK